MNAIALPILFATIAAVGNAIFAYGQKQSLGVGNGLLFTGAAAFIAFLLAFLASPIAGSFEPLTVLRTYWRAILISGSGLFLTYIGFYLLFSRFGASHYVLYAVLSIISTTVVVGVLILKEPFNFYHAIAVFLAVAAVIFYAIGQSRA